MAVQKRTTKAGKTRWVARYRDRAGKEHSKSFDTQREAKAWIVEQQRALQRGEWVDPATSKITLKDLCNQWAEEAVASGTRKDREFLAANLGDLADIPLHKLHDGDFTAWIQHLRIGRPWANRKPLSETNVINRVGQVRSLLNRAKDAGLVRQSVGVVLKRQPRIFSEVNEREVPTMAEIKALKDHAPTWFADAIKVGYLTGMRSGEVCGLLWRDVDLERGLIRVRQQCGKRVGELEPLKTRTSRRDIPISSALREVLDGLCGGEENDFVLRGAGGWGCSSRMISMKMVDVRLDAGVRPEISFHGLRHFFASTLLAQGVPLPTVSKLLGHSDISVTSRVYAHFLPGQMDHARVALDVLAGSLRDSGRKLKVVGGRDLDV